MAKNNNLGDFLTDIANAIRTKKGTSAQINAQNFSSEIASIPTGIIPTGTIDITQNGTYDVTNYASANVNTPTPDTKSITFKITLPSDLQADTTIVSNNDFIKANYNNSSLIAKYSFNETLTTTSGIYILNFSQGNIPIWHRASPAWDCYGVGNGINAISPQNFYANKNLQTRQYNDYGSIVVDSSGNMKVILGGGVWWRSGSYTITLSIN